MPIISLGVGSYQHSNRNFGEIRFPKFEIVGWTKLPKKVAEAIGATNDNTATAMVSLPPPAKSAMKTAGAKSRVEAAKPTAKKKAAGMKF